MIPIQTLAQGTRVRVRRGSFPLDPRMEGREGLVLTLKKGGVRYGVRLDGESETRVFSEDELEAI